ncbi:MAG: acyl-CoA dehydrogenase family protein [Gammaproteobacteria bacterium]|nr:acyl-CoA dehydrogenase family protein [Gammaproteobacteria bacterium]
MRQSFYQQPPVLGNQYLSDAALQAALQAMLPAAVLTAVQPELQQLGQLACGDMLAMAADAEANPPRLQQFDAWGRRIDRIATAAGWQQLHDIAAREGLVATAYQRQHGQWSRLHQFAKLFLYHPSSAVASCPLAMTDGAARVLELHAATEPALQPVLGHLLSTDPESFWTAGQWMTERTGGSDVSATATIAEASAEDDSYRLSGDKWFTSATTAQIALTLARISSAGQVDERLSLFLLPIRDADDRLNRITIHRLKDKLGTRALPTAELTMHGSSARLIGQRGEGIKTIATMLNITRLYNACCAAAIMRRALVLAEDYAGRREAFGQRLADLPLHAETLAEMRAEQRAAMLLVMHLAQLLGRQECAVSSAAEDHMLRLLVPVAKLYTGKQGIAVTSEALECFGGAGYVEDTGLPVMLRDAQVLSIWEGTTNVLSLDVLRALRDAAVWPSLRDWLVTSLQALPEQFAAQRSKCAQAIDQLNDWLCEHHDSADRQRQARRLAFAFARIGCAVLLLRQAAWCTEHGHDDAVLACAAAQRWCRRDLLAGLSSQQQQQA